MADYDSESSGDQSGDIKTKVLLGYPSSEPTGDDFSQLGGLPQWLSGASAPSVAHVKCRVCNGVTSLLFQLNADLPDRFPGHERRLYIFGCRRKACRRKSGCIRVLRSVRSDRRDNTVTKSVEANGQSDITRSAQPANLGDALFGVKSTSSLSSNANPFSTSNSVSQVNPFASSNTGGSTQAPQILSSDSIASELPQTFAEKVKITSADTPQAPLRPAHAVPPEPWRDDPNPYPRYYVDADVEYLDADSTMQDIPTNARLDASAESGGSSEEDKAAFESTLDKTFQRFADRLAQNPEQILRYEFGGEPLLYSNTDDVGKLLTSTTTSAGAAQNKIQVCSNGGTNKRLPRCPGCGASRAFEMQLTPHAITELEADEMGLDGMDWGTILIGVCTADCLGGAEVGQVGYVEEWAGVQWEELATPGKK